MTEKFVNFYPKIECAPVKKRLMNFKGVVELKNHLCVEDNKIKEISEDEISEIEKLNEDEERNLVKRKKKMALKLNITRSFQKEVKTIESIQEQPDQEDDASELEDWEYVLDSNLPDENYYSKEFPVDLESSSSTLESFKN